MDIQGSFFSPWELDAEGYGENVSAYYLDIKNPASEAVAYKALNLYKGQNNAGVKARDYLEKLGYDGVNNSDEEYIAFNSNQIKLISNTNPTENPDIRYSIKSNKKLTESEKKKYNKHSKRSEVETLFMQWQNGSAPVGEPKRFFRFGKHHYYEKTETGCVEISATEYAEKGGKNFYESYRRANNEIDETTYSNETEKARNIRNSSGVRNAGTTSNVSRYTLGEELRNVARRSLSDLRGSSERISVSEDADQQLKHSLGITDLEKENRGLIRKLDTMEKTVKGLDKEVTYFRRNINVKPGTSFVDYSKVKTLAKSIKRKPPQNSDGLIVIYR